MITPRQARPYEREPVRKSKQAALHAKLRSEVQEWAIVERFTKELLPQLERIYTPREGDPFANYRAQFSGMTDNNSGRAMASHIVADTRMDLIDMEAVIAEALADDEFMQMAEGFPLDGGMVSL